MSLRPQRCNPSYGTKKEWIASSQGLLAMTAMVRRPHNAVIPRACGASTPWPLDSIISVSGILDRPLEPVIGLAEGETRWRAMTAVSVTRSVIGRRFALARHDRLQLKFAHQRDLPTYHYGAEIIA
jgi:hypothetical protein